MVRSAITERHTSSVFWLCVMFAVAIYVPLCLMAGPIAGWMHQPVLFGLIVFLGMGLIIAGNFNNENSMGPVINLITLPQFLLSGTFFSTSNFPDWLQPIANNLPLSYLNVALRQVASDGASLWDVRGQILGLLIWGVISYVIAIVTFKWE